MAILEYLIDKEQQILDDLEELVRHESPTFQKELVNQCAAYIKELFFERLGVHGEIFANDQNGDHLKFEIGEGEEKVLILAHYDTVWEQGKLSYRIDSGKAFGPGIMDMKGGIIQGLWALKALKDTGLRPAKKVVFLLTSDEEQLSPTSRELIESEAESCKYVLVVEPPAGKSGSLKTARKGAGQYRITSHGVSSHAGNNPNSEASAIHEIVHQIVRLEGLADEEQGTTINAGVITGGTMSNVVAERAVTEVDVRFYTEKEARRIDEEIKNLTPILKETDIIVTGGINRPPMEKTEESVKLYKLAEESAKELGFNISGTSVGGVSDGNFTAAIGVPTLDGLGAAGDGPHALHEHIIIEELPKRTALIARLLLKL